MLASWLTTKSESSFCPRCSIREVLAFHFVVDAPYPAKSKVLALPVFLQDWLFSRRISIRVFQQAASCFRVAFPDSGHGAAWTWWWVYWYALHAWKSLSDDELHGATNIIARVVPIRRSEFPLPFAIEIWYSVDCLEWRSLPEPQIKRFPNHSE